MRAQATWSDFDLGVTLLHAITITIIHFRNLYGSLQFMKFIEVLNLANNNIKDLSTVLQQLSMFRSLRQLGETIATSSFILHWHQLT